MYLHAKFHDPAPSGYKVFRGVTHRQTHGEFYLYRLYEPKGFLSTIYPTRDLIVVQKTQSIEKYYPKLSGFSIFRRGESLRCGGVAIVDRENSQLSRELIAFTPANYGSIS